ncbi:RagB/SusD family nutrient uptake outer membrane protein [Aestuariibaculum sp. M13]|uniref:RagB/SusD family nutrient uptake outer membrane protein n=1 Tax=Aestuariibaculum sp. M13 TaxID=2967132 RepID=UPI00215A0492|nr:RagB/SusD family nutrient uptake outer membrane protein [Aestuariibaculum sp. M13]MCR8668968.1 RagB/SusD family nutrient uptake outer membrane protein [Aestuariibaculum sp. M13]
MKTNIYIFLILGLLFVSCDDEFLTNLPETVVSADDFFKTEEDFDQATIGMYAPLRNLYGIGLADYGAWITGEMRSDNTIFYYNSSNRGFAGLEYIDQFIADANGAHASTKYDNNYILIGRANQILSRVDNAEINEDARSNFKGQALFIRCFAYFDLVQYFGAVPLKLDPPASYNDTSGPRVDTEVIYKQIISDLELAITLLPNVGNQDAGRVTKGAAQTLLGNIYLVREEWDLAEATLLDVSGYSLLSDYEAIFNPANKGNSELIFEVQYWDDASAGLSSNFAFNFLPVLSDVGVIDGFPSGYSNGAGGWNIPSPELIASYESGDLRLNASIEFYTGGQYVDVPYIKKYTQGSSLAPNTNNNWPVYRYAEVLLMIAEAKNEQGEADAINYFNMVHAHSRTGLSEITSASQSELRDMILHERQIELAFENKRWLDLVRTNNAISVLNAQGDNIRSNPQNYYYPIGISLPPGAYNVTEKHLLLPIPQREIRVNPEISQEDQNPGY